MNADTAGVISGWLYLNDIVRCRRVSTEWYALFTIPPLEILSDYNGILIAARRHECTLTYAGNSMVLADDATDSYVKCQLYTNAIFPRICLAPSQEYVRFPVIMIPNTTDHGGRLKVKKLFGVQTAKLPIFTWKTSVFAPSGYNNISLTLVDHKISIDGHVVTLAAPGCAGYQHIDFCTCVRVRTRVYTKVQN